MQSKHRVMVYGSLKRGFGNHGLLRNATFVSEATVAGEMRHLGGYPAVTLNGDNQIHGELFDVNDDELANLDRLEGVPTFYQREKTVTNKGPAWIYTMSPSETPNARVIKDGVWRGYETA